ncbi:hypothetical protein Zmor_023866 [Zophobas morio]|uniref:Uncharacterized protein n=1 Tax=Zophobas morio TaxID=2755281 RepID=A0AA38I1Z6_9CUCU|nr:hypothetical protein Zmor_023866 [Zophobas morio]
MYCPPAALSEGALSRPKWRGHLYVHKLLFPPETGLISQSKPVKVFSVAFGCHHRHHWSVTSQDTPLAGFANLLCHGPEYALSAQVHTMVSARDFTRQHCSHGQVHPNLTPSLINTLTPNSLLLSLNTSPALSDHHNTVRPSHTSATLQSL